MWGYGDDSWRTSYASAGAGGISSDCHTRQCTSRGTKCLRLLAPTALLWDLANALDTSLAKAFGTLLEAPRVEAREAATAFLRLLVQIVRKKLIEGCVWF